MIKFLVFSDLHYDDVEDGDKRIDNILANAQSRQLDFIVSLGDLYVDEDGEIYLEPIEDEELFNKIGKIFEERLEDLFEFDEE